MLISGQILIDYAIVISSFTVIGTLYGMQLADLMHKRTGKHQYSVLGMIIGIVMILLATSFLSLGSAYEKHQNGEAIFEFKDYC